MVKCGGTTIATASGVDMVTGMHIGKGQDNSDIPTNIFAILAVVSAALVAVLAWLNTQKMKVFALVASLFGIVCLIAMYIDMTAMAADQTNSKGVITITLGFGYYLCFIGYLAHSLFFGLWMREEKKKMPSESSIDDVV